MIAAAAVVAVRNALVYPAIVGYDAQEAIDYAQGLVKDGRLPEGPGATTPPGFFAIGGVMIEVAERFDYDDVARGGQLVDARRRRDRPTARPPAPAPARSGRPPSRGGRVLRRLPGGDEVRRDVPPQSRCRCSCRRPRSSSRSPPPASRPPNRRAAALGLTLGLAQLFRAWTLWTVGVVVVVVAVAAVTRRSERRALLAALAVVIALAAVVPAPWYAHQLATYDSALFGSRIRPPVWSRRPLGFFVGAGLPEVVTEPYRPSFSRRFLPIAYAETWGDYFGVWRWLPEGGRPRAACGASSSRCRSSGCR